MDEGVGVKYVVTWWERPTGSPADYEAAQKRVLEVFQSWQMPESLTFHQFLVRVGEFGGYAVLETDDPAALHRLTTAFAVFQFRVEPVMDVMDAVAAESESIEWRDSIKGA
jgi:muconolactone delta-isomerase